MDQLVFNFRPEPGFTATWLSGEAMGLMMSGQPLFDILPVEWSVGDTSPIDGVLIGSANALRHGGSALAAIKHLPAFVVGRATCDAASDAGFRVKKQGQGGLQSVLDTLPPEPITLLRLAGEDHVDLNFPPHATVISKIVYRTAPSQLTDSTVTQLNRGGVVMLHSAGAATRFAKECAARDIATEQLDIAALGPRITAVLRPADWRSIHHCEVPEDGALLALAQRLCKDRSGSH